MRTVAASLAAVLALALAGCGEDGAEPGASREATLVLDFQPNAVHAGIYSGLANEAFDDRGVELEVRAPGASTDAPKLLAAGRVEFAILDIHDLALARERGLDLVGIAAVVRRPLAAVIAGDRKEIQMPADLDGTSVGVTGLPSDDAVLDAVLASGGLAPDSVERVTIGFDSIAALSSGQVDAATAFWNAEGVALRRLGVPTREFRVDDYGAPHYPELVLVGSAETVESDPDLVERVTSGLELAYEQLLDDRQAALDDLLDAVPELDPAEQRAQLDALFAGGAFGPGDATEITAVLRTELRNWARWDLEHGIVEEPIDLEAAFERERPPR